MIASVPQFAPRPETLENGLPVRKMSGGGAKGGLSKINTALPAPKVSVAPDDEEANPGGVAPKPSQTAPNPLSLLAKTQTNAQQSGLTASFSRAWAEALEQSESSTAQRLRSTKGLALPLASPKPETQASQQPRNNDVAVPGVFTNEKPAPLPLILSIPASASQPTQQNKPRASSGSAPVSAPETEDAASIEPSAPGELAFSAKVKSPLPEETFDMPAVAAPAKPAAIAMPAAKAPTEAASVSAYVTPAPIPAAAPIPIPAIATPIISSTTAPSTISATSLSPLQSEPISAPEAPATAPQPIKEIAFQLPGSSGVQVCLTEHLGEVRIDVRSGDAGLTQDLRGNLHELVSGLERKGFTAEVSHQTEQSSAPTGRSSDTSSSKDQDQGGQGGAFDRQPQQRNRQPGQPAEPSSAKARASAWNQQANSSFGKEPQ